MNPTALALVALVVALGTSMPASALHCNGTITTIDLGSSTLYHDQRSDEAGDINHWVYEESNGKPGLQSGHPPCLPGGCPVLPPTPSGDPCFHTDHDTLLL